jgi:hypothetical protein
MAVAAEEQSCAVPASPPRLKLRPEAKQVLVQKARLGQLAWVQRARRPPGPKQQAWLQQEQEPARAWTLRSPLLPCAVEWP